MIYSTVRDRVIDTLRRADGPMQQHDIARYSGDNVNSVRRTVQELRASGVVEVADYATTGHYPRLRLVPSAPAVESIVDQYPDGN